MEQIKAKNTKAFEVFVMLLPFVVGGFYVFSSVVSTAFLIAFLLLELKRTGKIVISSNLTFITTAVVFLFFLLSSAWAVDKGTAFMGAIKFLPLPLFSLALLQIDKSERKEILSKIPLSACIMTLCSFSLHFIPSLKEYFTVSGRLSGFFQYSNSFAVFLICSLVICAFYEKRIWLLMAEVGILIFGVFESGSRIAFAVLILSVLLIIITAESTKIKIGLVSVFTVGIVCAVIYSLNTGNFYTVGRFLTVSLNESTLLGRILYYKDALPVILRHPFGLGYMGYYFTQGEFQTGNYNVMFVHNELLQLLLDIGWVPAIITIVAVIRSVFSKNTNKCDKIIIISLCLHSLFDFDFQYISLMFIILLTADFDSGNVVEIKIKLAACSLIAFLLIIPSLWIGTSDLLDHINADNAAFKIYPFNTQAKLDYILKSKNLNEQYDLSEKLIKHNPHISFTYSVIANYQLSKGNIQRYIENEKKAIKLSPYDKASIDKYCLTLIEIHKKYISMGDDYSAEYCLNELNKAEEFLLELKDKTSELAWKIKDKPNLVLSDDISEYINIWRKKDEENS